MPPTLGQLLDAAVARLRDTSPTARADVDALAQHAFGLSRAGLIGGTDTTPDATRLNDFLALIERRRTGEPIAYIAGHREFWSLDLLVSRATLIPRPETELLVEQALVHIPADMPSTVFDLGTGSGAVALAIAHERPRARVIGTDCSHDALAIARANVARVGVRNVELRQGNWFAPLAGLVADVIVSNPPYVRADDPHLTSGDLRFEPRSALAAGNDGLDAVRHLLAAATRYLRPGGRLLLEHGLDQGAAIRALIDQHGYDDPCTHKDLAGHDRVTSARWCGDARR